MMARVARTLRTVRALHPLHVVARPYALLARRILNDVPSGWAPELVGDWPTAPEAVRAHAYTERTRGAERIVHLRPGSALRAYEETYGLELGADGRVPLADWRASVAIAPYPASVRARRIAVALRLGRPEREALSRELARAARAIALQPELHLLGNHLLENGLGLACAGAATRGPEADGWWRLGCAVLAWQLPRQFLADGGHFERSASYHLGLTAALLEAIELAESSGRGAPEPWRETARRALAWAHIVRAPDGTYPLFNDASLDGAASIDAVIALGDACGIVATADVSSPLFHLESTGWLRMIAPDGAWLMVDVGPDGPRDQPGHAHADGLTFELWVNGSRTVVDYGVASYADDDARRETRATRSHNTVEIDGRDSCEVWGAFRLGRRGGGRVLSSEVGDGIVSAQLEHDGYAWMRGAPVHRRTMTLADGRLEVVDGVSGGAAAFVSRVHLDGEAARAVRISVDGRAAEPRAGSWFPRQGRERDARVFGATGAATALTLAIEW